MKPLHVTARRSWFALPAALMLLLTTTGVALSQTVSIAPGAAPKTLQGTSGGAKGSNCGNIATAPNETLTLNDPISYMRLSVKAAGSSTLLIEGPTGRFCVMADGSGRPLEQSGFWNPGSYSVYVGDRGNAKVPYTLTISQTP